MVNILEICKANMDDLEEINHIYNDVIKNMILNNVFQWDEIYPNINILKEDIIKEQMYVGRINNEIVSCFVLNKEFDKEYLKAKWQYKGNDHIVLHRLCVKPNFQNNGIGTKTMETIEKYIMEQGIKSIRLDAFSNNPFSLKMYNKLEYKKVGKANWRKGLFYIFEKIV
jgi:GNAT superfamily N-acetyltransferase